MGTTRRKFTLEFKTEAAHRVIDTGRSVVGPPVESVGDMNFLSTNAVGKRGGTR